VYVRQSTLAQVRHHQESTERQYALRAKALDMGWSEPSVQILDGDLGKSGAQITGREDFKTLVAEVSMGQVGAVFALEVSRLARSNLDWHRLLELCALTDTLVIDEDGCYNPADFNDGLLLGLKGTMAQAELHLLRGRLLGGKLNKARKGECVSRFRSGSATTKRAGLFWTRMRRCRGPWPWYFVFFARQALPSLWCSNLRKPRYAFPSDPTVGHGMAS
jgi:DNA invertase Pin-like site-specific DNA recombinase